MNKEIIVMARWLGFYSLHILRRFIAHHCLTSAASLSFTSLLAIVPLAAIGIAILSAFPAFAGAGDIMTGFVLRNFTPDANAAIQETFRSLVSNAGNLTGVGILFLIFTSSMLLYEVEITFGEIWQVREKRTLMARITIFWAVITLGPILLGLGLSVSAPYFASILTGDGAAAQSAGILEHMLPVTLEIGGFSLLYIALPNVPVRVRHALIGGVIAGLLFEALKFGFGVYIRNFAAYEAIYGALSALPVFLIWTYLSWAVILFGAVVTAEMPKLQDAVTQALAGHA
ncbi:MAG: membrane protein [Alphaproteobacteria bacterium]|nr:membrane protein [Alphaproteobacteria bacterium]